MENEKLDSWSVPADGTDHGCEAKQPGVGCPGCLHWYGAYLKCCNYIFDVGKRRPCEPGEGCTVKRPIRSRSELKLRKARELL